MSDALYQITDRDLLDSIAALQAGFQPPAVVLEGLTDEQARTKPHGLPHSIADIVAHMCYWQEFFNRAAQDGFPRFPKHASEGWPAVGPGEWDAARERFLASVAKTRELAASCPRLDARLLPQGFLLPPLARDSIGSGLIHGAVHSAHHLGQVVTIRQLLGLWPPKGGSMTW